jgi:branched-subunit amino acid ABC-type transport system permease component
MESVAGVAAGAFVLALARERRRAPTRSVPTSFQDALSFTLLVVALVAFRRACPASSAALASRLRRPA